MNRAAISDDEWCVEPIKRPIEAAIVAGAERREAVRRFEIPEENRLRRIEATQRRTLRNDCAIRLVV